MLTITPLAIDKLKTYMAEHKISSNIRVTLLNGGCSGMQLGLAVDEFKDTDKTFTHDGVTFLMDEELLVSTGKVNISFIDTEDSTGFDINSEHPVGGGGCGSCSSDSCG